MTREPGRAPPRHAHGDLTSLAPHERLPDQARFQIVKGERLSWRVLKGRSGLSRGLEWGTLSLKFSFPVWKARVRIVPASWGVCVCVCVCVCAHACVCVTGADNRAEQSPEALPEPSCPPASTLLSRPEAGQGITGQSLSYNPVLISLALLSVSHLT